MEGPPAEIADSLRQRILAQLHLGTLHAGDRLPSHRELSAELHANPRRVLAAYQQLSSEGLVRLRPRSGAFAQGLMPATEMLPEVVVWMVETFMHGLARGLPPTEMRRQAHHCLDGTRIRAVCVECNDDQIHSLREQLRGDYGFETVGVEASALGRRPALPAEAQDADLIVTTPFHAASAQRLGRRLHRPTIVATLDATFANAVRQMLARGPVWWVCTDPRFAAKLPRMFPGASINPVVLGVQSLHAIPPDATVYATRRARERLKPGWHGGRVVTLRRVFSEDTARALLVFAMLRNVQAARESVGHRRRSSRRV